MKPRVLGFCQLVTQEAAAPCPPLQPVLVRVLAARAGLTPGSGAQEGCVKPPWVLRVTSCLRSTLEGISRLWCGHQSPLPGCPGQSFTRRAFHHFLLHKVQVTGSTSASREVGTRCVQCRPIRAPTREHCFQLPRSRQPPGDNTELLDEGKGVAKPGREPREQKE